MIKYSFPIVVKRKIDAAFEVLSKYGRLEEPLVKKINKDLFEIRIKYKGEWRVIFAYYLDNYIVILSSFNKKTQKAPINEIKKAIRKFRRYYGQ